MTTSAPDGAANSGTVRYDTTVTAVGSLVDDFRNQGMLILFGAPAPEELHDMCALHSPVVVAGPVQPGDVIDIDGHRLPITAVGERANETLTMLGHVSLKANGLDAAQLPGDISVVAGPLPALMAGSHIQIVSPANGGEPIHQGG